MKGPQQNTAPSLPPVQTVANTSPSDQYSPLARPNAAVDASITTVRTTDTVDGDEDEDVDAILPDDSSLSYIGDRRGPRLAVYDICHPSEAQDPRPYIPKDSNNKPRKPYEIEYMRAKGVFETFSNDVADEAIRCYFEHVHFFIPVVDAATFLNQYKNDRNNISPLLFWSMILAAANFVSSDLLRKTGYSSRRALKTSMYERAKCLYDFDRGTDKLVLIQSVILMGFWYTDPQDHTGAWHWTGIAISLCQNLGLHRDTQSTFRSPGVSESFGRHARCLWWTCFIRDRWVSLAKGRPMRIHHEDCDVPMPTAGDVLFDLQQIPNDYLEKFIPLKYEPLAAMWVRFVHTSHALGNILRAHYRVKGPRPSLEAVDTLAEELQECALHDQLPDDSSDLLRMHAYQVELFYQGTVTVLYRPYLLGGPAAIPTSAPPSWQKTALMKARAAASSINNILEKLIELNAIQFLKPMIITALVPSMQIHLFDYKSAEPLVSGLAGNRLQLCMLVLSKLRETYWSAGVMHRLFERAQRILQETKLGNIDTVQRPSQGFDQLEDHSATHLTVNFQDELQRHDGNPVIDSSHQDWSFTNSTSGALPLWDDPLGFDTVDELLGPGFGLPGDAFEGLFTSSYGSGAQVLNSATQLHDNLPQFDVGFVGG
ncbi:uncharacterized protein PV07_02004 [Cladophialophora immunda]|uniref:Xylanolytic transcriptional activator regulatory domain-containing protein n=1 Tax=Cladophialophora immunda TaxID=569365 RepID=A0A0D2A4N6_9EURO|nr:uncharacterized protein PV07_02004 [Cladophialophora immunda]KIW35301.1 hypothetical protein PV07_02004 [Cladophialophora immunda]